MPKPPYVCSDCGMRECICPPIEPLSEDVFWTDEALEDYYA